MSLGLARQADLCPILEELRNWKNFLVKDVGCYAVECPKYLHRDSAILYSCWDLKVYHK